MSICDVSLITPRARLGFGDAARLLILFNRLGNRFRAKMIQETELQPLLRAWLKQVNMLKREATAKEDLILLENSFTMILDILVSLQDNSRILIAENNKSILTIGKFTMERGAAHLRSLATAPDHLPLQHNMSRLSGGGSAIISHLLGLASLIHLSPLSGSAPFYKKLTFRESKKGDFYLPAEDVLARIRYARRVGSSLNRSERPPTPIPLRSRQEEERVHRTRRPKKRTIALIP